MAKRLGIDLASSASKSGTDNTGNTTDSEDSSTARIISRTDFQYVGKESASRNTTGYNWVDKPCKKERVGLVRMEEGILGDKSRRDNCRSRGESLLEEPGG